MNSRCTEGFWKLFNALPKHIQREAKESFALWQKNPKAKSLWFKPVHGTDDWWEIRATKSYRALCVKDGDSCMWFFIGSHADFDSLVP